MAPGKEYEKFVYDKMKMFFPDFQVTLDEKIVGKISGISRQIDVTIRGKIKGIEILYLVQCKDKTRAADIIIVGEFASVVDDLGATRGFLICAGGFAKTIHIYAQKKNIDLFTIQDINHPKWKVKIQISVLYKKNKSTEINMDISYMEDYLPKPIDSFSLTRHKKNFKRVSIDNGRTSESLMSYINKVLKHNNIDVSKQPILILDFITT
ncbi:restriction endonuclease [Spirosoma flavum]|uniref:Restriction endonuclease n=1 Tax=Spirosoma flavum TaxID=2048557 RepID=A0ABW6AJ23_9BACT